MPNEERLKIKKEFNDCFQRYEDAIEKLLNNPNSEKAKKSVIEVDEEMKSILKRLYDELGI